MSVFAEVDEEVAAWRAAGMTPRFWLRDDDATEPTPALERLTGIAGRFEAPLLLAVIPAAATAALAERLSGEELATPCVHGWAHRRWTPEDDKAVELGGGRPVADILAELSAGRERLHGLFGDRLSGILVPPWNRIAGDAAARVHECGFTAVSTASWQRTGTTLPEINTHVDIFDWQTRRGRGLAWTAAETARRLRQARERDGAALGILSHHLAHDSAAWETLEALLGHLRSGLGLALHRADDLVAAPGGQW